MPPVSSVETTRQIEAAPDDCALIPPTGEPIATVGLTDRIDSSNAPRPTNRSERLLFNQLYETLVRVDCMGRVRPGLASSWRLDHGTGRLWIVTLRENARFSDGTPVTAADVRASWIRNDSDNRLPTYVGGHVIRVDVVDERTLVIQLRVDRFDAPVALAHPSLAIAKRVAESAWPLGTRSSRIASDGDAARKLGRSELTVSRDNLPALRFLVAPRDQRDLLDAGVDLLVTRDPATLDYAASLPQVRRVPLAWQQTLVLLLPGRRPGSPSLSEEARRALAGDAVRGESRGAQGPFWWERAPGCDLIPLDGGLGPPPTPRVVYDANDGAARDLSERFVGLVGASGAAAATFLDALLPDRPRRTFQRATGLTGENLANVRRLGTDAGYVLSVVSRPLEPCPELGALMESIPSVKPWTIIPLVDTRLQAILRHGPSGATTEFDGAILIGGVTTPGSR